MYITFPFFNDPLHTFYELRIGISSSQLNNELEFITFAHTPKYTWAIYILFLPHLLKSSNPFLLKGSLTLFGFLLCFPR